MNLKRALLTVTFGLSLALSGILGLSVIVQAASAANNTLVPNLNEAGDISSQAILTQLPLRFIPNQGQTDSAVKFHVHSLGGSLFFSPEEVVFSLPTPVEEQGSGGAIYTHLRAKPPCGAHAAKRLSPI